MGVSILHGPFGIDEKMKKPFLLAILFFAMVIPALFLFSCEVGGKDGDDKELEQDECQVLSWLYYTCGYTLIDSDDQELTVAQAVAACDPCSVECANGGYEAENCDKALSCQDSGCSFFTLQ